VACVALLQLARGTWNIYLPLTWFRSLLHSPLPKYKMTMLNKQVTLLQDVELASKYLESLLIAQFQKKLEVKPKVMPSSK
jgi:hypothetical protein